MAFGLTRPDGREPALYTSTLAPPWMRANACAIWLRQEFSTQTNRMRFGEAEVAIRRPRIRRVERATAHRIHFRGIDVVMAALQGEDRCEANAVGELLL